VDEVRAARDRLVAAGLDVKGVTDHDFINSIYFFDPNGVRLELTVRTKDDEHMGEAAKHAHERLAAWTRQKVERLGGTGGKAVRA